MSMTRDNSKHNHNVFLNTVSNMNRTMYDTTDRTRVPIEKDIKRGRKDNYNNGGIDADLLLNRGVRASNQSSESSKLILSLKEEIKQLKSKMEFVIEKDKEIYRLECETKLLREERDTLKMTTVTDESLVSDNDRLQRQNRELKEECENSQKNIQNLQEKILEWHRSKVPSPVKPSGYIVDFLELQRRFSTVNETRINEILLSAIIKFRIVDKQWVPHETMNSLLEYIILRCKTTPQNI